MDQFLGKVLGNRYEIVEKVGEGGMALVYKAQCRLLNRYVAVKILRPEFIEDDEFIEKFDKESKSAASLSHPAIVNVYDVGADQDIRYIVMEYVNGVTLKRYIKDHPGFLSNREIISISKQIALALDHAHQNHIIHRDIKPHNILISEEGIVKVADFGIARAITTSTIINTTEMMGSVHYASPEQARGGFVDERSDLYSLGIILYELATKRVPFEGDSPVAVAMKHLKEEVILPSSINEAVSIGIESIIMKAIQKNPDMRYQSAYDMIEDLEDVLINPDLEIFSDNHDDSSPTMVMPKISEYGDEMEEFGDAPSIQSKRPAQTVNSAQNVKPQRPQQSPSSKRPKQDNFEPDRKKLLISVGLALLSVVLVFGIFFGVKSLLSTPQAIDMPNVVGLDYEEAAQKLEDLGLKVDMTERKMSDTVEVDQVISQSKEVGEKVKPGFTIALVISDGGEKIIVPNFIQKDFKEVQLLVENAGLKVGSVEYVQNEALPGIVFSQTPFSGSETAKGTAIDFFVSKGSEAEKIIIPKVLGLTLAEAKTKLEKLKIPVNSITYNFSNEFANGVVMLQSVEAGKEITVGEGVTLVVSKGKESSTPTNGGNTGSTTGTTGTDNTSKVFEKTFNIPLTSNDEVILVKVEKIQNNVSNIVYEKAHNRSDERVSVKVVGTGKVIINIYFNDTLVSTLEENFN